jgi:hypothetical protein
MRLRSDKIALILGLAASAGACQTTGGASLRTAILLEPDEQTRALLVKTIEDLVGSGRITLGPVDLTRDSLISVLPPQPGPYEGNSPAMPRYFELITDGKNCFLRERGKDELRALPSTTCRVQ